MEAAWIGARVGAYTGVVTGITSRYIWQNNENVARMHMTMAAIIGGTGGALGGAIGMAVSRNVADRHHDDHGFGDGIYATHMSEQ